jgi:lipopolysaccharide export system protein LptC
MAYTAAPDRGNRALAQNARADREAVDGIRAREFQRARRHSILVGALKVILPLVATGILSLYFLPSLFRVSIDNGRGTATVRAITVEAGSLKMLDPHVKGVNERDDAYDFTADSATQAARDADVMYLDKVRGIMVGHDGKVTTLTAPNAVHNNREDKMIFNNGALVTREPGMSAIFKTATAFMKLQLVDSKTPVIVRLHESTIHAESMVLFWNDQRAIFEGNVRTHIERQPAADGPAPQPEARTQGLGAKSAGTWGPQ